MVEGYGGFLSVLNKSFQMGESSLSRMVTVNMESIPGETVSDGAEVLAFGVIHPWQVDSRMS